MRLNIPIFKACVPKLQADKLPPDIPTLSVNYSTGTAAMEPLKEPGVSLAANQRLAPVKSLYRYRDKFLHWSELVTVAESPLADDPNESLYYADGIHGLRETNAQLVGSAADAAAYPVNWQDIGVPVPTVIPSAVSSDTVGIKRIYTYTFLSGYIDDNGVITDFGFEGAPSGPSNEVFVNLTPTGDEVTANPVVTTPTAAPNSEPVTHKAIYRLEENGEYHLVKIIPLAQAELVDDVELSGRVLETYDYLPPLADISNLITLVNGSLAAISGKQVVMTPAYIVYAWPERYRFKCASQVVGIVATSSGVVIGTKSNPYFIGGYDPESMTMAHIDEVQPCLSARSMVDMGEFALFAGSDGLVGASIGRAETITSAHFTRDQWQELKPETIHAYRYNETYVAFCEGPENWPYGGFIFDLKNRELMFHTVKAEAAHREESTGDLYVSIDDQFRKFDVGGSLTAEYHSAVINNARRQFAFYKVDADGPVDIEFWIDGEMKVTRTIEPYKIHRLPKVRGQKWQVRIKTNKTIHRFVMATNIREMQ